jgi:YfiH family protein
MSVITQKQGTLEYLTAQGIAVPHCFTTRFGGVSEGIFDSMNIAIKEGETEENVRKNVDILAEALGFDTENLICTRQTHTDLVRVVTKADHVSIFHRDYPECDALITNDPGTALMIYTADCTPLLFHDPVTGAVGAAHAGWKGTVKAIGPKTVAAMAAHFGCDPANIRAAIGPNIGVCHFETDGDVPEALTDAFGAEVAEFIRKSGDKYYVNLKEINAMILRRAGVQHIEISESCTVCEHHRFWSHRFTHGQRGSQGAIILCKEGTK